METKTVAKPLALVSALTSLVFAPSPSRATEASNIGTAALCAEGTCCPQTTATCSDGGPVTHVGYYFQTSGPCPS
jgi:hypothetical protein